MSHALRPIIKYGELAAYCQQQGIRRLLLFGSILRQDFSHDSDVDVLVEFKTNRTPGLIGLGRIAEQLELFFDGRPADLHTIGSINSAFRAQFLRDAEVQFDASQN